LTSPAEATDSPLDPKNANALRPGKTDHPVDLIKRCAAKLAAQTGRPMDVILGYSLLSRAVVEIDYAALPAAADAVLDLTRPRVPAR